VNEIIRWIIGGAFAILALLLGIEKRKTAKVTKAKEQAEAERDHLQFVSDVQDQVDKIKDEIVIKKAQVAEEKHEAEEEIKEAEGGELSEDVKKAASNQSDRLRDRANQ